jgi:hypothetical protein
MSLLLLFSTQRAATDHALASAHAAPEVSLGVAQLELDQAVSSNPPRGWNYMSLAVRWPRSGAAGAETSFGLLAARGDNALASLPSRGFLNALLSWDTTDLAEKSSGASAQGNDQPLASVSAPPEISGGTTALELVSDEPPSEEAVLARFGGTLFALFTIARGESGAAFRVDCRPWLVGVATMVEFILEPQDLAAPFTFDSEIVLGEGNRTAKFVVNCPADAKPGPYPVDVTLVDDQGRTGRQRLQMRVV